MHCRGMLLVLAIAALIPVHASALPASTTVQDCPDCPRVVILAMPDGRNFGIGETEVTWHQYLAAVSEAGCAAPRKGGGLTFQAEDLPRVDDDVAVSGARLADIRCYLGWLSKRTGQEYRLPTGAEWEFAARAGTTTAYPWGDQLGTNNAFVGTAFDMGRYKIPDFLEGPRNPSNVRPVAQLAPNAFGLFDVIGNVAEMVEDYNVSADPEVCRISAGCRLQQVRGGSYFATPEADLTTIQRVNPEAWNDSVGFRVLRLAEK